MNVSIVIPTYNGYPKNKKCIRSLLNQSLAPFKIIVVDNASDDGSKNLSKIKGIKYFRLDENTGVTGGRNYGISKVSKKTDYILIFDHDMYADKNMIKRMVELTESDPKIGIVTPKIYYWEDKTRIWSAGTDINLWTGQILFRGGKDVGQYDKVEEVNVAPACMLIRKEIINKGLRFDNKYFAIYEDTDFSFRVRKMGYKIIYQPLAVAWHDLSTDPKLESKRLLDRAYWVGKNRILFMRDFGKNFFVFCFFIPVYALYYFFLAIKSNRIKAGLNYMKGVIDGLFYNLSWTKYIPFSYLWILRRAIGNDVKTILDLGCNNGDLMKNISRGENWEIVGVELFDKAVEKARLSGVYKKVYKGDVTNLPAEVKNKKFDVIFSSQVLEHLPKHKGERALKEWEEIAGKRIVVSTTNRFMDYDPIEKKIEEHNIYQKHISGWSQNEFKKNGYKVFGQGAKFIYGQNGLARKTSSTFLSLWSLISYFLASFVYLLPKLGLIIICRKDLDDV